MQPSSGSRPVRSMCSTRSVSGSPAISRVQFATAQHRLHRFARAAVELLQDAALHVDREAFVQPEIAPGGVGHQVSGPGVRQFVRHQRNQALVAGQNGRRGEGEARILHAAEGKARRQHQQVVAAPAVRAVQLLDRRDHALRCRRTRWRRHPPRKARHTRPTAAPGGETPGRPPPARSGTTESAGPSETSVAAHLGAHHRPSPSGVRMRAVIRDAHARRVLQRDPTARVNRLRLRVQKGMLLAGRLRRIEPLQAGRPRRGRVVAPAPDRRRPAIRIFSGAPSTGSAAPNSKPAA